MHYISREIEYLTHRIPIRTSQNFAKALEYEKALRSRRVYAVAICALSLFSAFASSSLASYWYNKGLGLVTSLVIFAVAARVFLAYRSQQKINAIHSSIPNYHQLALKYLGESLSRIPTHIDSDQWLQSQLFRFFKPNEAYFVERRLHIEFAVEASAAKAILQGAFENVYTVTFKRISCSRSDYLLFVSRFVKKYANSSCRSDLNRLKEQLDLLGGNFTPELSDDAYYLQSKPVFSFKKMGQLKVFDVKSLYRFWVGDQKTLYTDFSPLVKVLQKLKSKGVNNDFHLPKELLDP